MTHRTNSLLTLTLLLLSTLAAFGQQWVPLSSYQPKTIQTQLISSDEEEISVHIQLPGFFLHEVATPRGNAQIVHLPKAVNTLHAGDPNLPQYAIPVVIGDQAKMRLRVDKAQYTDYKNVEIAPSKGDFPRNIDPATVPYTYGEPYRHDAFYPAVNADLYEPYILRDFRGQNLIVYPFAYNPVTKTLRVYHDLTVTMFQDGDGGANQLTTRRDNTVRIDPDFKNIYERHFINYHQALTRYTPVDEEGDLLILCHDAFMDAMTDFIHWKQIRGIHTTIVPMSSVGSEATDIQGFVLEQYNANPNLTHVLLVGDDAQVPGLYFTAETTYSDWSGKGDNVYGQVAGSDLYNDLFVGRFSANTVAQVATQVERTIHYERDIDATATWLEIGEGMAAYSAESGHFSETDYGHMENLRLDLLTYTYTTVYQDYADVAGYTCSVESINQHLNDGVGILNYINHGNEQMWSVASYCNENINTLTNDNKLPFIWSTACKVGKYDNTYTDHGSGFTVGQEDDCMAEAWMHATNPATDAPTGAIGGMFSYISQPWQPPMYGQDEMVDILIESKEGNIKHTLGGTSINGIMAIIDQYGASDINAYATHQGWVLYGDPSLMLRTKAPETMTVTHDGTIAPSATTYTVNVNNGEGAMVTLTRNYEILGSAKVIDGTAQLTIEAPGSDYTELTLCVFGFNKVTYLSPVNVNTGTPYTITATASPTQGGSIEGAGSYYADQTCTLTATPNRGYVFACWKQNGTTVSSEPSYSFTVEGDAAFTAHFTALAQHAVHCTESDWGCILTDRATACQGETVTLGTQPADGYSFSAWDVADANGQAITVTANQFTMPDCEVTVSATFVAGYAIQLAEVMYGTISSSAACAASGTLVTLTAFPANGYQFSHWTVYLSDDVNTTVAVSGNTFSMPAYNVTVSAVFSLLPSGDIAIGSGTSTLYYLPTFESYRFSLTEQIYTAAEVGGAGTISAIAFQASASKNITRALDIYMKNTEKEVFGSSTDWENVSTLYRVFSGNVTFSGSGWTTITLSTPFVFDGTSNLLLCVDDHTASGLDSYDRFYTYSTGENRAIITFRDGSAAYNPATANIYAGTRYTVNNQIRFTKAVTGTDESLSLSTERLFGFRYEEGEGPSTTQHFSLTGANLTGNTVLTAPDPFEISMTESGNFASTLTLTATNGQVDGMVHVRLKSGLSRGLYENETLTLSSGNIQRTVTLSGEVTGEGSPGAIIEQTVTMSKGWNWWSTNLDITLADLEAALGNHGVMIKSQTEYATYGSTGWDNSDMTSDIDVRQLYKIRVNASCEFILSGLPVNPADYPITLYKGYNWIGYPCSQSIALSEAFGNDFTPTSGDLIKSDNGYAIFNGTVWECEDLEVLEPGKGYIYKSNATEPKTFTFPTGRIDK